MKKHLQNDHIKKFNKYKAKVKAKDGRATKCQKSKKRKGVPPLLIIDFFLVVAQVIPRKIMFNSYSLKIWCSMFVKGIKASQLLNLIG
jgi:hypothetical protein